MHQKIYMDHNATTPLSPAARTAMVDAFDLFGNPSSVHASGRAAKALVDKARAQTAALTGVRPRDVVFTAGGTEANNTVLRQRHWSRIILSAVEHECSFAALEQLDIPVDICPVDGDGVVDLDALKGLLEGADNQVLVSVMAANNETGVMQPLAEIDSIITESGARFHIDAAQLAGKDLIDQAVLGADYISLSAHKFGGPKGVGALTLSPTAPLAPFVVGGGQELGRRSGTENTLGIAGLGAAAEAALMAISEFDALKSLRDRFEAGIKAHSNDIYIAGEGALRLANTSCVAMPGVKGETQVMHFDLNGIAVSSGSACSSGKVKVSHVLKAMGEEQRAVETIRVSLGRGAALEDIDALIVAWRQLYDRTRG